MLPAYAGPVAAYPVKTRSPDNVLHLLLRRRLSIHAVVPLHCDCQCVRTTAVAMYTIAKTFYFSASHVIGGLPPEHPCSRLHGHNYEVEVILQPRSITLVLSETTANFQRLRYFSRQL